MASNESVGANIRRDDLKQYTACLIGDGFVTVPFAAEFLGLSRSTIYALMQAGALRFAKFGRARRIPKKALLEFAASSVLC